VNTDFNLSQKLQAVQVAPFHRLALLFPSNVDRRPTSVALPRRLLLASSPHRL
jgi:hypothetical protein